MNEDTTTSSEDGTPENEQVPSTEPRGLGHETLALGSTQTPDDPGLESHERALGSYASVPADALDPVLLEIEAIPRVQYAMHANDVQVLRSIRVENPGDRAVQSLEIVVSAEPPFAGDLVLRLDELRSGSARRFEPEWPLASAFLDQLSERVEGVIHAEVRANSQVLAQQSVDVTVLTKNEWPGDMVYPELLAAFALPNEDAVSELLRKAGELLQRWTGSPTIDGYQRDNPEAVLQQAGAIYGALVADELQYVSPPASFESQGQRVRLPKQIAESRQAACLDLSLLAAAALEAAGLHPVVLIVEGHAFCGVWLEKRTWPEATTDDVARVRNDVELHDLVVFDPTCAVAGQGLDFQHAQQAARQHLREDAKFRVVIDVHRARAGGVRPMPSLQEARLGQGHEALPKPPPVIVAPDASAALETRRRRESAPQDVEPGPQRIETWKRKLLDLTLRNRLLNLPSKGKWVRLLVPDVAGLEDELAEERSFSVSPRPEEATGGSEAADGSGRRKLNEEDLNALLSAAQKDGVLHADMEAEPLEKRLTSLLREARTAEEEGGSNNLYLAVGLLKYFETEKSEKERRAPVILVPVQLTRRTAADGIQLRVRSDDPRINVTLLRYLEETHQVRIEGVDPPPDDGSGLDVPFIFQRFREEIRTKRGWEILPEARLAMFSFSKILIWRDLEEFSGRLMESPVVRHLVETPRETYSDGVDFRSEEDLDDVAASIDTFVPMSADSSQLAAILAAAEGKSFVLIGPPGTGKSQTITNLITHCLATGKSVLFVSEKMAALEVVHRRLTQVGLADRCLELHSNKANKKEVLEQLRRSMEAAPPAPATDRDAIATDLDGARDRLNAYVRAMHRRRASGESVFQVLSRLIGIETADQVELGWTSIKDISEATLGAARRAAFEAQVGASDAVVGPMHPLVGIGHNAFSPLWEQQAHQGLEAGLGAITQFLDAAATTRQALLGDGKLPDLGGRDAFLRALELLGDPEPITFGALLATDWDAEVSGVRQALETLPELRTQHARFSANYAREIDDIDEVGLLGELRLVESKWWLPRFLSKRAWRKRFFAACGPKNNVSVPEAADDLEALSRLRALQKDFETQAVDAQRVFGPAWRGEESSVDDLQRTLDWAGQVRAAASELASSLGRSDQELLTQWACFLPDAEQQAPDLGTTREVLRVAWDAAASAADAIASLLQPVDPATWRNLVALDCQELAQRWLGGWERDAVRSWCRWQVAREAASSAGLDALVQAVELGRIAPGHLVSTFERSFGEAWYLHTISADEVLRDFQSRSHTRTIEEFRELDEQLMLATHAAVRHRIQVNGRSKSSQLAGVQGGFLRKEIQKKRRHRPIRTLFKEAGDLIRELRPCVLMSPLSVAQYLDPALPRFDIVVFDEASQIPTWDAIGAAARGEQLIVVGDPKQLPPTNFFGKSDAGAEEEPETEDLESVLDECLASGIERHTLGWHYRSRHESLIAFSNRHYYDGRLITFPAAINDDLGVTWKPVPDGVYDFGKSRTNRREAEDLVAEILRRLQDPVLSRFTLGVVTLSQAQQELVDNLLDKARREHPEIERFFGSDLHEPVFVKNLENVQGDERDVILFTVCYGPDLTGRVRMNFGPLNKEGGWRRLNVAITRARREILVFSTLTSDQIDLNRTKSTGVRDLRRFLEFAEKGEAAFLSELETDLTAETDSPFEKEVCSALEERGWTVHRQVGCSGYRIDLAVVDPEAPGQYLLGIECDGASYHSAPSARDRDKLRQSLLEGLGWALHRIWSTDWWENRDREIEELLQALDRAAARERSAPGPQAAARSSTPEAPARLASASSSQEAPHVSPAPPTVSLDALPNTPAERADAVLRALRTGINADAYAGRIELYRVGRLRHRGSQQEFYEVYSDVLIQEAVREIARQEGPILLSVAVGRIGPLWGFSRMMSKAAERVSSLVIGAEIHTTNEGDDRVLWRDELAAAVLPTPRVAAGTSGQRTIQEIPLVELSALLRFWIDEAGPMTERELLEHAARTHGQSRLGALIRARLQSALDHAVALGSLDRNEGIVRSAR